MEGEDDSDMESLADSEAVGEAASDGGDDRVGDVVEVSDAVSKFDAGENADGVAESLRDVDAE